MKRRQLNHVCHPGVKHGTPQTWHSLLNHICVTSSWLSLSLSHTHTHTSPRQHNRDMIITTRSHSGRMTSWAQPLSNPLDITMEMTWLEETSDSFHLFPQQAFLFPSVRAWKRDSRASRECPVHAGTLPQRGVGRVGLLGGLPYSQWHYG